MQKECVLPIWQPVGYSTHEIARLTAEKYGVKTAHTGTLDPMAEGVVIILLGEERFKKYEYAKWKKGYEFEIVFGIETDTYDGLGIVGVEAADLLPSYGQRIDGDNLRAVLKLFIGKYSQTVPAFSTIKIKGKPLHWYARHGKLDKIELPMRKGEIFNIKLISLEEKPLKEIVENILDRIKLIEGDFRQEEIVEEWSDFVEAVDLLPLHFQIAKIYVEMSKGLYVRSLSQDIAEKLGVKAFVFSIKRTKNGKFTRQNSKRYERGAN